MEEIAQHGPFGAGPLEDIPLTSAPLARVLAQIRFPRLNWLASDDIPTAFAAAMMTDYPLITEGNELSVTITPDDVRTSPASSRLWQLKSADGKWQVSYGDSFLTVDTPSYSNRQSFLDQVSSAVRCFASIAKPPEVVRIGVRYVNRITDAETIARMPELVRPEVLGVVAVPLPEGVSLSHSVCDSVYSLSPDEAMHVRCGILPPRAVLDPALDAVDRASWILDLDAFTTHASEMDPAAVTKRAADLADRTYRYFRWAVTPRFLENFGGSLESDGYNEHSA